MYDVVITVYKGLVDVVRKHIDVSVKVVNEDSFDCKGNHLVDIYRRGGKVERQVWRRRKAKKYS